MRKNLGRFLIIFLLSWHVGLVASTYEWSAYSSKKEAFVNEAIYLRYVCKFSDRGELYNIDFNPVTDNEQYSVELLSQTANILDGKRVDSYEYIAFVKKPMLMKFDFNVSMKKTTQDSIENTVLGRDNVENEEFLTKTIKQKSLSVKIKETKTTLSGNFKIDIKSDKPSVKAYEPYHMAVTIKGNGNFKALKPIEFKIDGVKVFAGKAKEMIKLTKDGYVGSWRQKFAFVGDRDFKIPAVKIEHFDIKSQTLKSLSIESMNVKVAKGFKKEELLDDISSEREFDFGFIYYILAFVAGFLVAKVDYKTKKTDAKDEIFIQKIKDSKSLNELGMILALSDDKRFKELILEMENKRTISLDEAKKRVDELV